MVTVARSTKYPLLTGCRIAFPALLFAVSSVAASYDPVTGYISKSGICIRGGTKEEDVVLDAYIDELIASVDDEPQSVVPRDEHENTSLDSHVGDASTRPKKRRTSKKKTKKVPLQADETSDRNDKVIKSGQTDDEHEDDVSFTTDLLQQKGQDDNITTDESSIEYEKEHQKEEDIEPKEFQVSPKKEDNGEHNIEAGIRQTDTDNEAKPQEMLQRYPPPNALYRFLLDLGIVGQVLALLLMLITEYLNAYVPFLSSLLSRIMPQLQPNDRMRRESHPMSQFVSSAVSSRRTGQASRQRRKLIKQADQMALDQLKRVGNVQKAKYRYVSSDFLTRHGLGAYAATKLDNVMTDENTKQQSTKIGTSKNDDGGDWVLDALTKDVILKDKHSSTGKPKLSVDEDSKGLSAGFEFSLGFDSKQRNQVAKAALMSKNKKKFKGPKVSDRDGFLGRIRAAAGANSKNLLGAYPGDAVSLSKAGDPRGVYDLARRYGWGDWEEDDDDNTSLSSPRSRRTSKRLEASQPSGQEYFPSHQTGLGSARTSTHKQSSWKSKKKRRSSSTSNEPHEKEVSGERSLRKKVAQKTKRTLPRDPLERLLEAQGKSKRDD